MNTLTCTDIMVGDWVFNPHKNKNERISGIALNQIRLYGDIFRTRKYKPIPITSEILEKNGFSQSLYKYDFPLSEWKSEDGRVIINHLSNSKGKDWCVHIDNEDMETIGCADIQYVHELQHALRLCGVKKEIVM